MNLIASQTHLKRELINWKVTQKKISRLRHKGKLKIEILKRLHVRLIEIPKWSNIFVIGIPEGEEIKKATKSLKR